MLGTIPSHPVLAAQWAPRDLDLVVDYVFARLPSGRIFVHGARGEQTTRVVDAIRARRPDLTLLGFVDRDARAIKQVDGLPVVTPGELPQHEFDHIVPSHINREADQIDDLRAAGIAPSKIFPIYTSANYIDFAIPRILASFDRALPDSVPYCIVATVDVERNLLPPNILHELFPPEKTVKLTYGRPENFFPEAVYRTIDCQLSLAVLEHAIDRMGPSVIYLCSTPHVDGQYLGEFIKTRFPEVKIVHEISDWAILFSDKRLNAMGFRPGALDLARSGERFSTTHADLIVHKNGGRGWAAIAQDFTVPEVTYIPVLGTGARHSVPARKRKAGEPWRLIFAGSLPMPGNHTHPDLNYWPLFERCVADGDITIDLYNSNDQHPEYHYLFEDYVGRYGSPDGAIRYHRGVRLQKIVSMMDQYDFGWHITNHGEESHFEPVTAVGMGNKTAAYIVGGLPVLVDDRYEFIADLLVEFGAGIVLPTAQIDRLPDLIRASNLDALRGGIALLHQHLAGQNLTTVEVIRNLITDASTVRDA